MVTGIGRGLRRVSTSWMCNFFSVAAKNKRKLESGDWQSHHSPVEFKLDTIIITGIKN